MQKSTAITPLQASQVNPRIASPRLAGLAISDKELYSKCQFYGKTALVWRQKFIGLLPEVNRRRLYEKKGFSSIFEFAFKLCGLSAEQVRLALNLEKRFEDKPVLKKMLETGEASINKLARVAFIATPENEEELAGKVKILPISALNTFVKDVRQAETGAENQNAFAKPLFEDKVMYVHDLDFEIADDIKEQFNALNSKGIDVNEFLREMLKQRREKIEKEKEKLGEEQMRKIETMQDSILQAQKINSAQNDIPQVYQPVSRYIPEKIKKILRKEHGEKCSIATCQKPAEIIHHTQRWSLSQNHDPRFLAPLCKDHHIIAHSVDLKYLLKRE